MTDTEKLLKYAMKYAEHAQINTINTKQNSLTLKNNSFETLEFSNSKIVVVKIWRNNKLGFSYSNIPNYSVVDDAIKISKATKKEEYFYGLQGKNKYKNPKIYDKRIEELEPSNFTEVGKELIRQVNSEGVTLSQGGVSSSITEEQILNSNGIDIEQKFTDYGVYAATSMFKEGKSSSVWDSKDDVRYVEINNMGTELREKTLQFLDAKKLKSIPKNRIINPEPFSQLLSHAFLENLNGKNVEKGKSIFKDKLHENVCSTKFSIVDDGTFDYGINTRKFDTEGTPKKQTELIKYGILKHFIYNYNTAKHAKKESTGNANQKNINFSNLVVDCENIEINDGLIIDSIIGAHTSNPITTDFSVGIERGYLVKDGKIYPIKGHMFSGKMLDILSKIEGMGDKIEQKSGIYTGPLVTSGGKII